MSMPSSSFFTVEPQTSTHSATVAGAGEQLDEDTAAVNELPIDAAPIPFGGLHQLNARGRTFRSTLHPLLSQGQLWIAEKLVNARSQSSLVVNFSPTLFPFALDLCIWLCRVQARLFFLRNSSFTPSTFPIRGLLLLDSRFVLS